MMMMMMTASILGHPPAPPPGSISWWHYANSMDSPWVQTWSAFSKPAPLWPAAVYRSWSKCLLWSPLHPPPPLCHHLTLSISFSWSFRLSCSLQLKIEFLFKFIIINFEWSICKWISMEIKSEIKLGFSMLFAPPLCPLPFTLHAIYSNRIQFDFISNLITTPLASSSCFNEILRFYF